MSQYKPYPAYKDSGVEWIGKVPEHWKIRPVKHLYRARLGKMIQPQAKTEEDVLVPYHRAQTVQWERVEHNQVESMWAHPSEIQSYSLEDGDLLICEGGDVCRAAVFNRDKHGTVIFQNSIHRVRPVDGNQPEWLLRLMQHVRSSEWIDVLCNKNTIVHFTSDKLASLEIPHPPPSEQVGILGALRRETTRIDALIAKKTEFIELLAKKRQALITHAVTKGLNTKAKMRDSGVEWIGEVPEHWNTGILSRISTRTVVGIAEAATHAYAEVGTPILRSTNIRPYKIIGEILRINADFAEDRESKMIHANDLITVRTGNAGVTAVIPKELDGCQCFTMLITTLKPRFVPIYYCYWMNSAAAIHYFSIEGWGTAQINISVPILKELPVPIPPTEEQQAIAQFLDRETGRIDLLSSKTQYSIDLLKTRRSALITAAVTGQIDLRESA